jgi:hypothetical protein
MRPVLQQIASSFFNRSTVELLSLKLDLAGILVLSEDIGAVSGFAYSPNEKSPQSYITSRRGETLYPWNPDGEEDAIILKKFDFAIVSLPQAESEAVREKAEYNEEKNGQGKFMPYVAEFNYEMFGTGTSLSCLESTTCLPVGGFSVWATADAFNTSKPELTIPDSQRRAVLASAMLDSSAFFHDQAYGASSYQSGVVALLGAATAIARVHGAREPCVISYLSLNRPILT